VVPRLRPPTDLPYADRRSVADTVESAVIDELSRGRYPVDALLEGQTFKARAFEDFAIHPRDGAEVRVKDCIFDRCRVTQGSFSLGRGVVLERVLVRDLEGVGRWELHSGTRILDSSFECSSPSVQLWIRNPQGDPGCESNRIELDISRFAGEVLLTAVGLVSREFSG
jgi:hypothetical protein